MFNNKTISLLLSLGLMGLFPSLVNAQAINEKEPNPFQDNEKSPVYGEGINPMDLIHNANLLNSRSASDFAEDTDKNLNQAADDFKREQQRRIQEMQQQQSIPESSIE